MNNEKERLMREIQELCFAKVESELFLDTHPECTAAAQYHREITERLMGLEAEYSAKYTPITAGANMADGWNWAKGAWPWQNGWEE